MFYVLSYQYSVSRAGKYWSHFLRYKNNRIKGWEGISMVQQRSRTHEALDSNTAPYMPELSSALASLSQKSVDEFVLKDHLIRGEK